MQSIKKILAPVDFSPLSEVAAKRAVELAQLFQAELKLLHVVDMQPMMAYGHGLLMPEGKVEPALEEAANKQMQELLAKVQHPEVKAQGKVYIRFDTAWSCVVEEARKDNVDLIVLSTHGRTGVNRLVMGSVAENIIRHATCQLWICPPQSPKGK